jgi:hypothetical protein
MPHHQRESGAEGGGGGCGRQDPLYLLLRALQTRITSTYVTKRAQVCHCDARKRLQENELRTCLRVGVSGWLSS